MKSLIKIYNKIKKVRQNTLSGQIGHLAVDHVIKEKQRGQEYVGSSATKLNKLNYRRLRTA